MSKSKAVRCRKAGGLIKLSHAKDPQHPRISLFWISSEIGICGNSPSTPDSPSLKQSTRSFNCRESEAPSSGKFIITWNLIVLHTHPTRRLFQSSKNRRCYYTQTSEAHKLKSLEPGGQYKEKDSKWRFQYPHAPVCSTISYSGIPHPRAF